MPTLYQANGDPLELGGLIGKGGEGAVHEIPGNPALAAKLYHRPIDAAKAEKLRVMVQLQTERLLNLAAWPISVVSQKRGGPPVGLLMRRIIGYKEAHHLYSPKSRKVEFGNADWRFLVHACANLSRVVAVIHEHGHVIGDVNHGNFLVNPQALAALIDCDSFQIAAQGKDFLCEVGVPTYTPPELQNHSFAGLRRTPNHDNFGLAVLIFHHLFMGRHPFAGRYQGSGEMSIEKAISEYRFAFSRNARNLQMSPPPHSPELGAASEHLADLFERAFSPESSRPDARPPAIEWISALDTLGKDLRPCAQNQSHYYFRHLKNCPWCEIEDSTGVVLFSVFAAALASSGIDVAAIWAKIQTITAPGPSLHLSPPVVQASEAARRYGASRRRRDAMAWFVVFMGMAAIFGLGFRGSSVFWTMVVVFMAAYSLVRSLPKAPKDSVRTALARFSKEFHELQTRWNEEAGDQSFAALRQELEACYREHNSLPALRQRRHQELAGHIRENQLTQFLESQYIEYALIPKIGPGRKAALASYGIETAADINATALSGIPGFGPAYKGNLLAWRASVEASFHFDPNSGVDPKDVQALDREIVKRRNEIEAVLSKGARQLEQKKAQIVAARAKLQPALMSAWEAKLQMEADLAAM